MFCSHCGFELVAQMKFCSNCGKPVSSIQPIIAPVLQSTPLVLPPDIPAIPESLRCVLLEDIIPMKAVIRPAVIMDAAAMTASVTHGEGWGSVVNGTGSLGMDIQTDIQVKNTNWLHMLDTGREVVLSELCGWESPLISRANQVVLTIWLQFPEITIRDWDKRLLDEAWEDLPKNLTRGTKHPRELLSLWDHVAFAAWRDRQRQTDVLDFVWNAEGICIALTYPQNGKQHNFPVVQKSERAVGGLELCAVNLSREQNIAFDKDVLDFVLVRHSSRENYERRSFIKSLGRGISAIGANRRSLVSLSNWANQLQKWAELGMPA